MKIVETFAVDLTPFYTDQKAQKALLNDAKATGHAGYIANADAIVVRARKIARQAVQKT